jgi:peptidoglycan/xylan/chitin deacetylase (PgdA/CDA1 family)
MIRTEVGKGLGRIERRLFPGAPVILIYHRVANGRDDRGIVTPPDLFVEQIEALRSVRQVVRLAELLEASRGSARAGGRSLAAITFDDGYHDVFAVARPILDRLECPSTVFVTSGLVDQAREFWWDELACILVDTPQLPSRLELRIGGRPRRWDLPADDRGARDNARHGLRKLLRNLSPPTIEQALQDLRAWAGVERAARPSHRAATSGEIAALRGGQMTVGAHTVTHPALPYQPKSTQAVEIFEGRRACEAFAGVRVDQFAYPFGDYDGATLAAVRRAGFACACTTVPSVVRPGADPFQLPRLSPARADAAQLLRMLG